MTREEAIKILKEERWYMSRYSEEYKEAYDMAIEALSADAVSREDTVTVNSPTSFSSDFVHVVRCKDCRYRHDESCPMFHMDWFTVDEGHGFYSDDYNIIDNTKDDDYCSHGERAEQTDYKMPGYDDIMDRLDNLEITIHGKERIKRIKEGDND